MTKVRSRSLVTGGAGFTGSHLVRRLLGRGDDVRVLDTAPGLFADELTALGAELTLGSVTDRDVVDHQVAGVDRVFHVAAVFRKINLPDRVYHKVNAVGTRIVGEAALRHGVTSFVYCSTQGVHGDIASPPGDEDSPITPEDYYQRTKYEGEEEIAALVARGLPATTVRPMAIYGPGDPARFLFLFRAVKRGRFLMFGSGDTLYHPLYIDNLVDAFELAGGRPGRGEVYLIGDAQYYSLNDSGARGGHQHGHGDPDPPPALRTAVDGGSRVRGDLQTARHRTAVVPAPRRLVPPEPGVSHRQRAARARL